jgi:beta-carotene 3-hydroxylase
VIGRDRAIGESGSTVHVDAVRRFHHRLLRSPYFAQKAAILPVILIINGEEVGLAALQFVGWMFVGFWGLELLSYALHRWVFHGLLWRVHRTHHVARHGPFELNDLFSVFFAFASIGLLIAGLHDPFGSPAFGIGAGFTVYGVLYFLIHDLFTHRRYLPFQSRSPMLRLLKQAHLRHHHSAEKPGQEPFGLFLFDPRIVGERIRKPADESPRA